MPGVPQAGGHEPRAQLWSRGAAAAQRGRRHGGPGPRGLPRAAAQHVRHGDGGGAHGPHLLRVRPLQRRRHPNGRVGVRPERVHQGRQRRAHRLLLPCVRPQQRRTHQPRGDVPPAQELSGEAAPGRRPGRGCQGPRGVSTQEA